MMNAEKPQMNKTKVSVPPPVRTNRAQFMDLPTMIEEPAPKNLTLPSPTRAVDLNFKVTEEFHRAFKAAAAVTGISMKEVLEESFRLWIEQNQIRHVAKDVAAGVVQERSRGRIERELTSDKPRAKARTRKPREDRAKPDMFRGD